MYEITSYHEISIHGVKNMLRTRAANTTNPDFSRRFYKVAALLQTVENHIGKLESGYHELDERHIWALEVAESEARIHGKSLPVGNQRNFYFDAAVHCHHCRGNLVILRDLNQQLQL